MRCCGCLEKRARHVNTTTPGRFWDEPHPQARSAPRCSDSSATWGCALGIACIVRDERLVPAWRRCRGRGCVEGWLGLAASILLFPDRATTFAFTGCPSLSESNVASPRRMWWLAAVRITSQSPIGGFWRHPLGLVTQSQGWHMEVSGAVLNRQLSTSAQYSCGPPGCHVEKLEDEVQRSILSHTSEGVWKIVTCRRICRKSFSISSINWGNDSSILCNVA